MANACRQQRIVLHESDQACERMSPLNTDNKSLESLYSLRFAGKAEERMAMWKVLCRDFFQRYVPRESRVLDLGCGSCEFINNISAREKTGVDIAAHADETIAPNVHLIQSSVTDLRAIESNTQDIVFTSNLFEHLTREEIRDCLQEVIRVLAPDGAFLILQPSIRWLPRDFWMFFDHITPIDDRALVEALVVAGFSIAEWIPRFLPFTTRSRIPQKPWMVALYLRLRLVWRFVGKQSFIVANVRV